jgi:uncharacterized integral membrane protein (TIGR00697 family)
MHKIFNSLSVKIYLTLSCIFCAIYVSGNLIVQKFIYLNLASSLTLQVSVGVLFYPLTFIITDLITEFFGKKFASYTVLVGLVCDILILSLIFLSDCLPATTWSPVDNETFTKVFSVYGISSIASLSACYISQTADIMIFSHIKKLTGKRIIWLRCNVSTIIAQLVDTFTVVGLLCIFGLIPVNQFFEVTFSSYLYKLLAAIFLSTPFFYLGYYIINKLLDEVITADLVLQK